MTKYELINPSQILDDLQREIELGILGSSQDMLCIKYWKNVHDCLSSKQYKQHISWKNIERFESVSHHEAIFLLLNLPTRFLSENKQFDLYKPHRERCLDDLVRNVFTNSIECEAFDRANLPWCTSMFGDKIPGEYPVQDFIKWATNCDFIIEITKDTVPSNIDKHNKGYKKWSAFHNAKITINAYDALQPPPKSVDSLFVNTKFYNSIKDKLVHIADEGEIQAKIPSIGTVKNHIYEYNKFKINHL